MYCVSGFSLESVTVVEQVWCFNKSFSAVIITGIVSFLGYVVAQSVEALRYKPEGRRFSY